ncbi:RNA polymerase sigma factor SigJ [Geminicoccaceae bacterium 1502E]|nr:RNA polymerase sigma factor SigJ [Geminicoccaceae bacterium 1502E]
METLTAGPFEAQRPRLRRLAYRLLGSLADAEDVVQDAWLRWRRVDPAAVLAPERFLTTVVTRLALDRLRAARRAREAYEGQWLPEPVVEQGDGEAGLERRGELALGLLLLLERLTPRQRAVYVLRESFALEYEEIAAILETTAAACRQAMRRARGELAGAPEPAGGAGRAMELAAAFSAACLAQDYARLVGLLADGSVLLSDGGGKGLAARRPVLGSDRIARFFIGVCGKPGRLLLPVRVNGDPGVALVDAGGLRFVAALEGTPVRTALLVANPDKLPRGLAGGGTVSPGARACGNARAVAR